MADVKRKTVSVPPAERAGVGTPSPTVLPSSSLTQPRAPAQPLKPLHRADVFDPNGVIVPNGVQAAVAQARASPVERVVRHDALVRVAQWDAKKGEGQLLLPDGSMRPFRTDDILTISQLSHLSKGGPVKFPDPDPYRMVSEVSVGATFRANLETLDLVGENWLNGLPPLAWQPPAISKESGPRAGQPTAFTTGSVDLTRYKATDKDRAGFRASNTDELFSYTPLPYLSAEEATVIRSYSKEQQTPAYEQLNGALRAKSPTELAKLEPVIKCFASGLNKLPGHEGTVYRGAPVSTEDIGRYAEGAVVAEPTFLSASTKAGVSRNWQSSDTLFVIESRRSGKNVSALSAYPGEDEVLFSPGTKFKVLARSTEEKRIGTGASRTVNVIYLVEA